MTTKSLPLLGFLFVDKPTGMSSFEVVRVLRARLNIERIGFAGTLDPLAKGLMILALGESTKLITYLEGLDKVYEVNICFGGTSDTYDANGLIKEYPSPKIPTRQDIEEIIQKKFIGEIDQMPPAYSAIKVKGRRAYSYARKGDALELKSRKVSFFDIKIVRYAYPNLVCTLHCSSGTYVRSFAYDIGEILKCGGYVSALRRTKIGSFSVQNAVPLQDINALNIYQHLVKAEELFSDQKQYNLNQEEYDALCKGSYIENKQNFTKGPILAMYKETCVGVLEVAHKNVMGIPLIKGTTLLKFQKKLNIF